MAFEMNLTPLDADLDHIQKLDDEPNDVGGLSAAELKAEFDRAGNDIKGYLNDTLIPEVQDQVRTLVDEKVVDIGAGDMTMAVYDPTHRAADVFEYVDRNTLMAVQSLRWELIQSYEDAGAYEFTVPDLFDGEEYEILARIIGAGGSGGAAFPRQYTSGTETGIATGGASGYAENVIQTLTPGTIIPCVVGEGAPGVVLTSYSSRDGGSGGASSFSGLAVLGGEGGRAGRYSSAGSRSAINGATGGQGSDALSDFYYSWIATSPAPAMGEPSRSARSASPTGSFTRWRTTGIMATRGTKPPTSSSRRTSAQGAISCPACPCGGTG